MKKSKIAETVFFSFMAVLAVGLFLIARAGNSDTSVNRSFVMAASHDPETLPHRLVINGTLYAALLDEIETATAEPTAADTATLEPTATEHVHTDTPEPTSTDTQVPSDTATVPPTDTAAATVTPSRTPTPSRTSTPGSSTPFVGAPLCEHGAAGDPLHDTGAFHTIWDSARGCHYDHEHGQNPDTPAVAAAFPGFDLKALLCGVWVGHCNPSSPAENHHNGKHGGMKWDVNTNAPKGCALGFESGTVAIDAYAVQYHSFGRQDVEFEANKHSAVAMLRQCKASNPADKGYLYVATLQHYGERVTPYQGQTLQYPDDFIPRWDARFGPYFSTDNTNNRTIGNPNNLQQNSNSKWTSKLTGCQYPCIGQRPPFSTLYRHLFDVRDAPQILDMSDLVHPFKWLWMCGGNSYNPANCRYNNSTGTIHEVMGNIPSTWDNTAFDSDPRTGRITAEFFVDSTGVRNTACTEAGGNCYPIKMVSAFVGLYSSDLCAVKCSNNTPANTPERDIYFLNGAVVGETTSGAVPSGWIGSEN